jgi:hypothetical protein
MHGDMSNKIRSWAESVYVAPARRDGRKRFAIPVRDVLESLVEREGLPRQNVPQVCQALRSPRKFLEPLGLEIEKIEGPEKQTSTTVVYHYKFRHSESVSAEEPSSEKKSPLKALFGLLREELAELGGGEAFLKTLRTDPERNRQ